MTEKLFEEISNRVDKIQSKIDFLNELEMRIDTILGNLTEEPEDEEDDEEDDEENDKEDVLLIGLKDLVANTSFTYTE
jgi:hypothetical protein